MMKTCPSCNLNHVKTKAMVYTFAKGKLKKACKPPRTMLSVIFVVMLVIFANILGGMAQLFNLGQVGVTIIAIPLLIGLLYAYRQVYKKEMARYQRQWACLSCGCVFE